MDVLDILLKGSGSQVGHVPLHSTYCWHSMRFAKSGLGKKLLPVPQPIYTLRLLEKLRIFK
jgi:hypothetical protein